MNKYFLIVITVLNLFLVACGQRSQSVAHGNQPYVLEVLFGVPCIHNTTSIWCFED